MHSIPLYHLSTTGRAAIDAESARIKQELANRRAERESRLQPTHGGHAVHSSALPSLSASDAVDPQAAQDADRP